MKINEKGFSAVEGLLLLASSAALVGMFGMLIIKLKTPWIMRMLAVAQPLILKAKREISNFRLAGNGMKTRN
jgi:hypothetical protein